MMNGANQNQLELKDYMLKIFYYDRNQSYDKIMEWLKRNEVDYTIINLQFKKFQKQDILRIINDAEDIRDLFAKKSSIGKSIDPTKILNKSIDEFCDFIIENPRAFKLPIMYDERFVQVGYSDESIDVLLPEEKRKKVIRSLMNDAYYG